MTLDLLGLRFKTILVIECVVFISFISFISQYIYICFILVFQMNVIRIYIMTQLLKNDNHILILT